MLIVSLNTSKPTFLKRWSIWKLNLGHGSYVRENFRKQWCTTTIITSTNFYVEPLRLCFRLYWKANIDSRWSYQVLSHSLLKSSLAQLIIGPEPSVHKGEGVKCQKGFHGVSKGDEEYAKWSTKFKCWHPCSRVALCHTWAHAVPHLLLIKSSTNLCCKKELDSQF